MTTMRSAGQPSSRALAASAFLGGRLQTCRRLIDDGSIGDVTAASAFVISHGHEWFHPNPDFFYKPGAGPLHDIGPYYVVRWGLCSAPPGAPPPSAAPTPAARILALEKPRRLRSHRQQ